MCLRHWPSTKDISGEQKASPVRACHVAGEEIIK